MIIGLKVMGNSTEYVPLVKPDATPEEVTAVVDNTDGAGGQIFSQAVRLVFPIQLRLTHPPMVFTALGLNQVWSVQSSVQGSPGSS